MGIGAGYCEGNLNFATASEDDEVYTKKKVSRVSRWLILCILIDRRPEVYHVLCSTHGRKDPP